MLKDSVGVWGLGSGEEPLISLALSHSPYTRRQLIDKKECSRQKEKLKFRGGDQGGECVWRIDCTFLTVIV